MRRSIDEMHHAGGFGGAYQHLGIRADRHALGLGADRDLADRGALFHVDDGHHRVVFIGDVERFAGWIERELLGIGPRRQLSGVGAGLGVEHLDHVIVADRDENKLAVAGHFDAARPLPGLDGRHRLHLVGIDHRDRIAFFVGDIGQEGGSGIDREKEPEQGKACHRDGAQSEHGHSPTYQVQKRVTAIAFGQLPGLFGAEAQNRQSS